MTYERNNNASRTRNKNDQPRRPAQQQRLTSGSAAPAPAARRESLLNPAMAEGLSQLMRQSFAEAPPEQLAPHAATRLPPIPSSDKDGVTYINFSASARTELGQILSFDNMLAFDHTLIDVRVPTIQHFWAFIQSGGVNPKIFSFSNDKLRAHIRQQGRPVYQRNQYALLAHAYWLKFMQYPALIDVMVNYTGEFDYFLDRASIRKRPVAAPYLVDIMKQIRSALRRGHDLDLVRFMDRDVQMELRTLTNGQRDARVAEILDKAFKEARTRQAQIRNNRENQETVAKAAKHVGELAINMAEEEGMRSEHEVSQTPVFAIGQTGFQPRVEPAEPEVKPELNVAFLGQVAVSEDGIVNAAPKAPQSPEEPAAPEAPQSPADPEAPVAPSAPVAETANGSVDPDGETVVLDGFNNAATAVAS